MANRPTSRNGDGVHLPESPIDRLLALFAAAGVGVGFMEPRAFWFGALICLGVALAAGYLHGSELKEFRRKRRTRRRKPVKFPASLKFAVLLIMSCIATPILIYLTKADPLLNTGILSQSLYERLMAHLFEAPPRMQLGTSKVFFTPSTADRQVVTMFSRDRLSVETVRGELRVSSRITDQQGNLLGQISNNEWKVAPIGFDRNYDNHALEILDAAGDVVLQVNLVPDAVQIQGYWFVNLGPPNNVRRFYMIHNDKVTGFIIAPRSRDVSAEDLPKITPMFKYPSDLHPGEVSDANPQK